MAEDQPVDAKTDDTARQAVSTGKPSFSVKVYAPFKVYFEGEAYSLSAINATGPFDILPHHHKFLCMLVPCNLTIRTQTGEKVIKISRALMHVEANRVVVFVDV